MSWIPYTEIGLKGALFIRTHFRTYVTAPQRNKKLQIEYASCISLQVFVSSGSIEIYWPPRNSGLFVLFYFWPINASRV